MQQIHCCVSREVGSRVVSVNNPDGRGKRLGRREVLKPGGHGAQVDQ